MAPWIQQRVVELVGTSAEFSGQHLWTGGGPFRWDEKRRFLLRCELNAAFFHLYGIERDDADYIMETFPIVKRKDETAHGEYRTKRVILEIYDEMAEAARTGTPYRTRLDPPPADPRVAHPESEPAHEVRRRFEVPLVPMMPSPLEPHPLDAPTIVWALLHASGGSLRQQDLARAFSLWSKPALLADFAPPELRAKADSWSAGTSRRSIAPGTLGEVLVELTDRQTLRRTTNDTSQVAVSTTEHTPARDDIDPWFHFEARLVLAVLATLPPEQAPSVDAGLSDEDRHLFAAGAA